MVYADPIAATEVVCRLGSGGTGGEYAGDINQRVAVCSKLLMKLALVSLDARWEGEPQERQNVRFPDLDARCNR